MICSAQEAVRRAERIRRTANNRQHLRYIRRAENIKQHLLSTRRATAARHNAFLYRVANIKQRFRRAAWTRRAALTNIKQRFRRAAGTRRAALMNIKQHICRAAGSPGTRRAALTNIKQRIRRAAGTRRAALTNIKQHICLVAGTRRATMTNIKQHLRTTRRGAFLCRAENIKHHLRRVAFVRRAAETVCVLLTVPDTRKPCESLLTRHCWQDISQGEIRCSNLAINLEVSGNPNNWLNSLHFISFFTLCFSGYPRDIGSLK